MRNTIISIDDIKNSKVADRNKHLFEDLNKKPTTKRSKYGSVKEYDEFGNIYDSKKELKRAKILRLRLKAGDIGFLARQVEFTFHLNGGNIASYFADFVYTDASTGEIIVEDVKSEATRKLPAYRLKRKMMWLQHQIKIKEV